MILLFSNRRRRAKWVLATVGLRAAVGCSLKDLPSSIVDERPMAMVCSESDAIKCLTMANISLPQVTRVQRLDGVDR